jgi:hypothetical protein
MYTFSNQTTIECCLSIFICFMLLFCQSITSQTSITFLFVLNYEFPLVFLFPFVFAIPFIPLPFSFQTIPDLIPFPMIKCGYENGRGVFLSVSVCFHAYSSVSLGFTNMCCNLRSLSKIGFLKVMLTWTRILSRPSQRCRLGFYG